MPKSILIIYIIQSSQHECYGHDIAIWTICHNSIQYHIAIACPAIPVPGTGIIYCNILYCNRLIVGNTPGFSFGPRPFECKVVGEEAPAYIKEWSHRAEQSDRHDQTEMHRDSESKEGERMPVLSNRTPDLSTTTTIARLPN